ncbi:MAG TPA: flagellar biosynthesis protein FlhA [Planctomycetota bacterium]|nr:flagellar biosynthesis protein FlhA [Planctomycetota bacterium]
MANQAILTADGAIARSGQWLQRWSDWILGIGVLGLILTLIAPIAPWLLDMLLALNIAGSLLLLLLVLSTRSSPELSVFPTLLLFATLFRLGLNVASTRLILAGGSAGKVISAFGSYMAGSNLTVGFVLFLILIVIQFIVITKGSSRVSEVTARFVLDAMPGKQMAIDADLNSGLITVEDARARREKIASEAEFYGAMDGATKFVRGDAVAGLIITGINLIGGVAIATIGGLSISEAGSKYSILTIGDGLVCQIPALLVSTAAAVLVTKASSTTSLGVNVLAQVGGRPRATLIAAGMLFAIGLLPGLPKLPFLILASMLLIGWRATRDAQGPNDLIGKPQTAGAAAAAAKIAEPTPAEKEALEVEDLLRIDRISLEIGYRLIPLVQAPGGNGVLDHIAQLRRRFAGREGMVMPPVRIKDNIRLAPGAYRILLGGQEVARGEVEAGHCLAMDPGNATGKLKGKKTTDPAFGLPAWWIHDSMRDEAELAGYTVVDPTSVLVTHLTEVLRNSLGEILSRDDVKELVENAKKIAPAVVEELVPARIGFGDVQAVLKNLLRDGVSIRNLPAILEAIADHCGKVKDPDQLSELVRQRLARSLCEQYADKSGTVHAVTLDPAIEARLASAVGGQPDPRAEPVGPAFLSRLVGRIGDQIAQSTQGGKEVVLVVRSNVRRFLNELVRASLPKVSVLSYNEVVPARVVETLSIVRMEDEA